MTEKNETSGEGGARQKKLDPARQATVEKMREAAEAFRAGKLDEVLIPLPDGRTVRMMKDESQPGGFVVQAAEGGPSMRTQPFQPSEEAPEEYPDDLPFLPETAMSLAEMGEESRSVTWFNPDDLRGRFQEVQDQLRDAGWEAGQEEEGSEELGLTSWVRFTRGDRQRLLSLSQFGERGQILLLEKPHEEEKEGE